MRPIVLAHLDKTRPALVLTRAVSRPQMTRVTIAPITSRVRGLSVEVAVGPRNGLDHECVVNLDNIATVDARALGRQIGWFFADQEGALTEVLHLAFDLSGADE
ncbi:MAG: type II toxin-antitoxin system PemK/MazF family toxin [Mobilicoccus sp.]|nr:type II toxin-antitoxin system PemK/MazF family toxin [Mobilicoccus sp.]